MGLKHNVVFFGTGPVARDSLAALAKNFAVELVVTKPKPAHHRGNWPVADQADQLNLPIAYGSNKTEIEQTLSSYELTSQVGIVIDFGVIISAKTIDLFPAGIINSHFSLLPRWRGADPITYAILHGDQQTGVSLMKIVPKMDEGPLIAQQKIPLEKLNSAKLSQKLVELSDELLEDKLPRYLSGEIEPSNQTSDGITYSHKIAKHDGLIDWSKNAETIEREIRAYYQWPRSRTKIGSVEAIISQAEITGDTGKPGQFSADQNELIIYCGQKSLRIIDLQPIGKKLITASEFIRGYRDKLGLS